MTHMQDDKKSSQFSATDVFSRMGVAMEDLLKASQKMWDEGKFDGREMQGKLKNKQKAA